MGTFVRSRLHSSRSWSRQSLLDFPAKHWDNYICPFRTSLGVFAFWRKFAFKKVNL